MISPSSFAVFALKFLQKSMMFRPCGPSAVPTGGAGVALPAAICSLITALTFFLPMRLPQSLDLEEVELHGRFAPEHVDQHLQLALFRVDLGHLAMEVGERPVDDAHVLALLVLHRHLGG